LLVTQTTHGDGDNHAVVHEEIVLDTHDDSSGTQMQDGYQSLKLMQEVVPTGFIPATGDNFADVKGGAAPQLHLIGAKRVPFGAAAWPDLIRRRGRPARPRLASATNRSANLGSRHGPRSGPDFRREERERSGAIAARLSHIAQSCADDVSGGLEGAVGAGSQVERPACRFRETHSHSVVITLTT
jgi:hypothetical protein